MPRLNPQELVRLPWSIRGPSRIEDEHGTVHYAMRILELPDFFVAGATESEVLYEFRDALLAFLDSYIREGEVPPLPKGDPVRFLAVTPPQNLPAKIRVPNSEKTAGTSSPPLVLAEVS